MRSCGELAYRITFLRLGKDVQIEHMAKRTSPMNLIEIADSLEAQQNRYQLTTGAEY